MSIPLRPAARCSRRRRQLFGHVFLLKGIDGIQRLTIFGLFGFYLIVKIGLLQQRVAVQRLLEFLLEF